MAIKKTILQFFYKSLEQALMTMSLEVALWGVTSFKQQPHLDLKNSEFDC